MSEPIPTEEWRAIPGYEGRYEVSSNGRVRSLTRQVKPRGHRFQSRRTNAGRLLATFPKKKGYLALVLPRISSERSGGAYVHRLVALAFLGPANGRQVNHKDGNKTNNHFSNLEWVSAHGNMQHAHDHKLIQSPWGERHRFAKLTALQVLEIRSLIGTMAVRAIGRKFGVSHHAICNIRDGKTWANLQGSLP